MNAINAEEVSSLKSWRPVGTVVGNAGTSEFTFILRQYQARVGDIVALSMEVPDAAYNEKSRIYVWARITDIRRFNPFFPFEAAQEIAGEGISLEETILSGTKDQLEAAALILGASAPDDLANLAPLTYPVKPASTVFHPPAGAVRKLLIGGREQERAIKVGCLIARSDVDVTLSASRLVSRHLAILAMTGGGKTVAARRIIRELIQQRYPLLILDPHGDYIGLYKTRALLEAETPGAKIRLFYPELLVQEDGEELVTKLILQMTSGLTDPQRDYLHGLYDREKTKHGEQALKYIGRLLSRANQEKNNATAPTGLTGGNWKGTIGAICRGLRIVQDRLDRMERSSKQMRDRLKDLEFEPLPNPFSQPEKIIQPGQVSILYLGGYDHITQCSLAAITLETLFEFRATLSNKIAPFFAVVEEAHTFIPSAREGTQDAVSLPVVRRIITEGRKFGTGLMLISQRPSRLDETIISQCNSFLILRLVNPRDQTFVRSVMENLSESDARLIPGFGPGQGIVSGQVVRFPLPVRIHMDKELLASEIGDEDFFDQAERWAPDANSERRAASEARMTRVKANRKPAPKPAAKPKTSPKSTGRRRRS
ncbi:ATP-binding protein [Methylobacterium organophilum]|uniref:Helicase HerA central domain-containing protein n=1 Tax=Methylobacterium organophilum TaxID=410 RepID=A0ABQ4T705_METOR|nr:ATP-binding protein [Methylobacterium organophilum]GJE26244.1 hypothetical protein LKMONMHP_1093 [Methylobacterium organophilum]